MAFWGVLLQPNEPYTLHFDPAAAPKRLRISQATLADRIGIWNSRSVVRCAVGSKAAVFICSLSMREVSSCQLDLEFEETEDVVFSVKGPRGVHLVGYFHDSTATKIPGMERKQDNVTKDTMFNTTKEMRNITDDTVDVEVQNCNPLATRELEERVLITNEKSGPGRVMSSDDNDEEQINEKTKSSFEDNRSLLHKCDINVLKESEHQAMVSNPTQLLQEIEYARNTLHNNDFGNGNTSNDTHMQSKKVEKKKKKGIEHDVKQLDTYIINGLKQREQDQHVLKEGVEEITKENAINGSCEEKSHKDGKRRRGQQHDNGNPKGSCMKDGGGFCANDHHNICKEEKNKLIDSGIRNDISEDHNIEGDLGGRVYATEDSVDITMNEVDDRKQKQKNDKLVGVAEQANGRLSSISHKKKKKKVRVGEASIGDDKDLTSHHNHNDALVSQSKLPNGRVNDYDGYGHERSDNNVMKDKKKEDLNDDEDKHVGKKRKVRKNVEATGIEGKVSSIERQKSSNIVKGDHVISVQLAGNAKGVTRGGDCDQLEVAMEVEGKDDGDKVVGEKKGRAKSKRIINSNNMQ